MNRGTRRSGKAHCRIVTPTALPAHMCGPVLELTALRTDAAARRQGHAQSLMLAVGVEADLDGTFLMVHVEPEGDVIAKITLAKFYACHGFGIIQGQPLLMVRPPVRARIAMAQQGADNG